MKEDKIFGIIIIIILLGALGYCSSNKKINSADKTNSVTSTSIVSTQTPITNWVDNLNNNLIIFGTTYNLQDDTLIITVDENSVMFQTPFLMQHGYYKEWITKTYLENHPIETSYGSSVLALALIVSEFYTNFPDLDKLNIIAYITQPDIYGNLTKKLLFTCEIDKKLISKINWKNFNSLNIPKVFYNFQLSNWYITQVYKESAT